MTASWAPLSWRGSTPPPCSTCTRPRECVQALAVKRGHECSCRCCC
jgi:hypothetical protein